MKTVTVAVAEFEMHTERNAVALGSGSERLVAGSFAFAVARYTEEVLATVGVGMATLWILLWM